MKKSILLLLLASLALSASAQHRRHHSNANNFDFTLTAGLNMCQIDGDRSGNYNKPGFHAGVNTTFPLGEESGFRLLVGVGLSQKGSTIAQLDRKISTLYIELPVMLTYNFDFGSIGSLRLGAGLAPAVLGKATVKDAGVRNAVQEDNFRAFDALPFVADAQYRFGDHWGLEARFYTSLLPITHEAAYGTYRLFLNNKGAFHRLLSIGLSYRF